MKQVKHLESPFVSCRQAALGQITQFGAVWCEMEDFA
jgi:hypothetical protein